MLHLPPALDRLNISRNRFEGVLDFSNLPDGMKKLDASHNAFAGVANVENLPRGLKDLRVESASIPLGDVAAAVQALNSRISM